MAKSLRSKSKRNFRRIKRESGVFGLADAARLHRLSAKLQSKLQTDNDGDVSLEKDERDERDTGNATVELEAAGDQEDAMNAESTTTKKKISTKGRGLSRRDEWRLSKGKPLQRKNSKKLNRVGVVAAKRKAGRAKRRR